MGIKKRAVLLGYDDQDVHEKLCSFFESLDINDKIVHISRPVPTADALIIYVLYEKEIVTYG